MKLHTPPPWYVMQDAQCMRAAFGEPSPGLTIASMSNSEPICRVYGYLQPLEANARLIVAAPSMYETLRVLLNWKFEDDSAYFDDRLLKQLRNQQRQIRRHMT